VLTGEALQQVFKANLLQRRAKVVPPSRLGLKLGKCCVRKVYTVMTLTYSYITDPVTRPNRAL